MLQGSRSLAGQMKLVYMSQLEGIENEENNEQIYKEKKKIEGYSERENICSI